MVFLVWERPAQVDLFEDFLLVRVLEQVSSLSSVSDRRRTRSRVLLLASFSSALRNRPALALRGVRISIWYAKTI